MDGPFAAAGWPSPPRSAQAQAHLSLSPASAAVCLNSLTCTASPLPLLRHLHTAELCCLSFRSTLRIRRRLFERAQPRRSPRIRQSTPLLFYKPFHLALVLAHGFFVADSINCPCDSRRRLTSHHSLRRQIYVVSPNRAKTPGHFWTPNRS